MRQILKSNSFECFEECFQFVGLQEGVSGNSQDVDRRGQGTSKETVQRIPAKSVVAKIELFQLHGCFSNTALPVSE
jgi:hypothetical protein